MNSSLNRILIYFINDRGIIFRSLFFFFYFDFKGIS